MTSKVEGGCFCGAIRFQLEGPEKFACFCYCESCQRATGAPVVAWATYARENFQVVQGSIRRHRSSSGVTRGICGDCGSCISYQNDKRAADIDITLCCLDDPSAPQPRAHIWTEDKQPWIVIGDDLPVHERNIG